MQCCGSVGLVTGTFTRLREKKEGRGRGNIFGERCWMQQEKARGNKKQERGIKQLAVKTTDR